MTSTSPVEESRGKAYVVGQWEAGTRARDLDDLRGVQGKAYVVGQREAGTQVYRLGKEARSGMTKESRGKAYVVGQWEAGTRCTDLGQMVLWENTGRATYRWFEERQRLLLCIYV